MKFHVPPKFNQYGRRQLWVVESESSGLSESNGEIHASWAVPLTQVREAILFAMAFGVVMFYGVPYAASKLEGY